MATNLLSWFLVGLLFGPIGIILALIGAKPPKPKPHRATNVLPPLAQAAPTAVPATPPRSDPMTALAGLSDLRDRGAITDAEYEAKKTELLGPI